MSAGVFYNVILQNKKICYFCAYDGFQAFSHHIFRKKNMLHLSHILKQKLDIVIGLQLSIEIWQNIKKIVIILFYLLGVVVSKIVVCGGWRRHRKWLLVRARGTVVRGERERWRGERAGW